MPVSTSAKKALRRDERRANVNNRVRAILRNTIKKITRDNDPGLLPELYQAADRAAKKLVIHPNKAARIKSRISRTISQTTANKPAPSKPAKSKPKKSTTKASPKKTTTSKKKK